jgi:hypothetical protein
MFDYFNIPPWTQQNLFDFETDQPFWVRDFKLTKTKEKIVVVRNPYDRLLSAIKSSKYISHLSPWRKTDWIRSHSVHYLFRLTDTKFNIIDFNKLKNYIGQPHQALKTNSVAFGHKEIFNEFWSEEEMEREFVAYNKIMEERTPITVTHWKDLYK